MHIITQRCVETMVFNSQGLSGALDLSQCDYETCQTHVIMIHNLRLVSDETHTGHTGDRHMFDI